MITNEGIKLINKVGKPLGLKVIDESKEISKTFKKKKGVETKNGK